MDRAQEIGLIERVLAALEAGSTEMADAGGSAPTARYHDERELAREMSLFRSLPLPVAHASRLARPGDFVTLDGAGAPLLVVRGEGAPPRAFLNVCRHRGTRVEQAPCGEGKRSLVCPYHGWTYDLAGRLLHIPHEAGFCDVDRAALNLVELGCEVRHGLVWVTPSRAPRRPVAEHLGALGEEIEALGLDGHVVHATSASRKPLNWKLAVEIFLEAYHLKRAHARSIYPRFLDNVGLCDPFPPHQRGYFPKRTIAELRGTDPAGWRAREHGNLLYFLFPNTLMLVQSDHVNLFHLFPRGTDETEIIGYTLIPEAPRDEKARRHWDRNVEILMTVVQEDFAMGASIQQGIRSGANEALRFGRYEQGLVHFHAAIQSTLAALGEEPPR